MQTENNPMIGPAAVYETAKLYIGAPETLSHDVRTILGYVYRDYSQKEREIPFAEYALIRWKEGTFPQDALV